jgi:hypothetical protein
VDGSLSFRGLRGKAENDLIISGRTFRASRGLGAMRRSLRRRRTQSLPASDALARPVPLRGRLRLHATGWVEEKAYTRPANPLEAKKWHSFSPRSPPRAVGVTPSPAPCLKPLQHLESAIAFTPNSLSPLPPQSPGLSPISLFAIVDALGASCHPRRSLLG